MHIRYETHAEKSEIDAPLVFVGYGINAPESNWDDYNAMDVKGKLLLMLATPTPQRDIIRGCYLA